MTLSRPRAILSWSSGKDSAFALDAVRRAGEVEVVALLTTVNETFARVAMHAVREELLDLQAQAIGLPLWKVPIPYPCPNDVYETAMSNAVRRAVAEGITHAVFGDLFLTDIRAYREKQLLNSGLTPLFPLWMRDTTGLAREMITSGLGATIVCVDPKQLDPKFAGRAFDDELIRQLPGSVDPCGENGEFHTFAWDGPVFRHPVRCQQGAVVQRDGFYFADLMPA
jgi:uncharacterized protein (TIGR00290 family)